MQSRCIHTNIAKTTFPAPQPNDMRCFCGCSLFSRILNAALTVRTAMLTPPPRLTKNKYYISQDSIAYRVILSLACLRALRFARSTSARAIFVGVSSFVRCAFPCYLKFRMFWKYWAIFPGTPFVAWIPEIAFQIGRVI